jgi:hypothetical protein
MNILITGGTGFIGKHLIQRFTREGHLVTVLTRGNQRSENRHLHYLKWNGKEMPLGIGLFDVVINLAGSSIAGNRWTPAYKQEILSSRVEATRACVDYINHSSRPPQVFISASAVGYYGANRLEAVDEQSAPGSDFVAEVAIQWEAEAAKANVRTVCPRIGLVLGKDGGMMERLLPIYRGFLGGRFASGKQGFPWIHIDDLVNAFALFIEQESIAGPVNLAAPEASDQAAFSAALAKVLGVLQPFVLPKFALDLIFGEMSVLFWGGQQVIPRKLEAVGYGWRYPRLEEALRSVV